MDGATIFGAATTRAFRPLWAAQEVGLDYSHVPHAYTDPVLKSPEFLALNPNGFIPVLTEGAFSLWESMAIAFYIVRQAESPLLPQDLQQQAKVMQWLFWVMTEIEKPILAVIFHRYLHAPEDRVAAEADKGEATIRQRMPVLEQALSDSPYLLGDAFTLADLGVASVLSFNEYARIDFSNWPATKRWLGTCLSRPAAKAAMAEHAAEG